MIYREFKLSIAVTLTLTLTLTLALASNAASCTIESFTTETLPEARVWRARGKLHFEGPGVKLHATVSCTGEPGNVGQIGWVQNVAGWESVRDYEHGQISIEAPAPPIWDGGSAPYPWYSEAGWAFGSTKAMRLTLADVPGGETDLQTYVQRNVGAPFKSRLQKISKHTRLEAAVVWQRSGSTTPVVLGVIKWSQTLRLAVEKADSDRPSVRVEKEWVQVPNELDTSRDAIAAFQIPNPSLGKFEDVYQVIWKTNNPDLTPRVVMSRRVLPKIVSP